jgi:thioredoxin-disulfide reductase
LFDCIIIGAGPAGLTAAIYLIRKKLKILVLTQKIGGQIMDGPLIENYPGIEKISGADWVEKTQSQAKNLGVEIKSNVEVKKIKQKDDVFEVEIIGGGFEARSIIICSGKSPRKLNVSGEEKLIGKGISVCVTCDGPLFSDKEVAVIGGGNSAISAALELEKYARKIYIINLGRELVGEEVRIEKLRKSSKIEVIAQAKTIAILGENSVQGLKYKDLSADRQDLKSGQEKEIKLQGIFVEIGWVPSTGYLEGFVELTPAKEVHVDKSNATNVSGVFAAGDVTDIKYKQLIIACGEGAKAALACWNYLTNK